MERRKGEGEGQLRIGRRKESGVEERKETKCRRRERRTTKRRKGKVVHLHLVLRRSDKCTPIGFHIWFEVATSLWWINRTFVIQHTYLLFSSKGTQTDVALLLFGGEGNDLRKKGHLSYSAAIQNI